jgi:hypothetical protein
MIGCQSQTGSQPAIARMPVTSPIPMPAKSAATQPARSQPGPVSALRGAAGASWWW